MARKQLKLNISERRIKKALKKVKRKLKAAREDVTQKMNRAENRYQEIVQIRREMIQSLILATQALDAQLDHFISACLPRNDGD